MRISADTEEWPEMDWENKRWSSNIFLQSWAHTVKLEFVLHNVVNSQSKRLIIECQSFLYNCILAEFWPPFGTCGKLQGTSLSFAWSPLSMKCKLITTVNVLWGLPLSMWCNDNFKGYLSTREGKRKKGWKRSSLLYILSPPEKDLLSHLLILDNLSYSHIYSFF